jgi:hypothetical protein
MPQSGLRLPRSRVTFTEFSIHLLMAVRLRMNPVSHHLTIPSVNNCRLLHAFVVALSH